MSTPKHHTDFSELRGFLLEQFSPVKDPRVQGRCSHSLIDVLVLCFCGVLSGCKSFIDIAWFGVSRFNWLTNFLEFKNGIPSHDTLERVLGLIEPKVLEKVLRQWAQKLNGNSCERVLLDGKALKGNDKSFNDGTRPLHVVNVFDFDSKIVLAQAKSPGSGMSELEAAIECVESLRLKGALVSADAGLCNERLRGAILSKKADYLVPIKKNQPTLFDIFSIHSEAFRVEAGADHAQSQDNNIHGRNEFRECFVVNPKTEMMEVVGGFFEDIKTVLKIVRIREEKDRRYYLRKTESDGKQSYFRNANKGQMVSSREEVFYISSRVLTAAQGLKHVRDHWSIENDLHWSLDVNFGEDNSMIKNKTVAANLAVLRKMAFNLETLVPPPLPKELEGKKVSRRSRRFLATLDTSYLEAMLIRFAQP